MNKLLYIIIGFLYTLNFVFAGTPKGLFISEQENGLPGGNKNPDSIVDNVIGPFISTGILYVAVFAVIALVISGFLLMTAGGEEEKVKRAKIWVIWSLVGVVISISAYMIISFVSNITIDL